MKEKNYTGAVPDQHHGEAVTAQSVRVLEEPRNAIVLFNNAKSRLLDVNHWHQIAGEGLAEFKLADETGRSAESPAKNGMFIQIDIPGPGSKEAGGYDWVQIEEISEVADGEVESIAIRVRPASAPGSDEPEATHFYDRESTSTFTITREKNRVTAAIYDRNIQANTETDSLVDKVRNAVTGFMGKKVFSGIQWQSLADGLLEEGAGEG